MNLKEAEKELDEILNFVEKELDKSKMNINEETEASYTDALYTRVFKKSTKEHTDGNNNCYVELNSARAKLNDKIYKNSNTGENFETADDFANAVCECYRNRYPENYNENEDSIRNAAIDRFQRH